MGWGGSCCDLLWVVDGWGCECGGRWWVLVVDVRRVLTRDDGGGLQEMLYYSWEGCLFPRWHSGSLIGKEGRGFIDDVAGRWGIEP